ncbi:hypothetical protein ASE38_06795 [Cellulomonas sp. Root930]|nr:hypothetical protein ASE38_06795 [Cellulomonas sp. Root930]
MEDNMSAPTHTTSRRRTLKQGRLTELLARREQVGTAWAERASHGLPGLGDLTQELTIIEFALTEQWPHLAQSWLPAWVISDARKLHDPSTKTDGTCRICVASARQAVA